MTGPPQLQAIAGLPQRLSTAGALAPLAGLSVPPLGPAGTIAAQSHPRGVDLNLNQFSLETPTQNVEGDWVCEPQSAESCKGMVDAF